MLESIIHDLLTQASKSKPASSSRIIAVARSKGFYQYADCDVRETVRQMRLDGAWICANGRGYYYATTPDQLLDYLEGLQARFISIQTVHDSLLKSVQCTAKI